MQIKRLLAALTLLAVVAGSFVVNEAKAEDYLLSTMSLCGDVNLDGSVTTADVTTLMRYCGGIEDLNEIALKNSDVNNDDVVNMGDVIVLLRYKSGQIDALPHVPRSSSTILFRNVSFPLNDDRVNYGEPYKLEAILTSMSPLKNVKVQIVDVDSAEVEIVESVKFPSNSDVRMYQTSGNYLPIDNKVKFASLSKGEKLLKVIASNDYVDNSVVFSSRFSVGFSYSEVAPYVFRDGESNPIEARRVLLILNDLSMNSSGGKILSAGVKYLGRKYSTMDCSMFVRSTIDDALGVKLPRTSCDQAEYCADNGLEIEFDELRPGDLIFTAKPGCDCGRYHEIHHSSIYLGESEGIKYVIESSSSDELVTVRRLWGENGSTWKLDSYARIG